MSSFPLILAPNERIVWEGDRQRSFCVRALTIVVVLSCIVTAAAFSTMNIGLAYKAIAGVACFLIVVSAVADISPAPKRYVLTNHRITELDSEGNCLWRDGCALARKQEAKIRRGLCGWTVTINTVQMDPGDPETVQVGPLQGTEAMKFAELLPPVALEAQAW